MSDYRVIHDPEGFSCAYWIGFPGRFFGWKHRDFEPAPFYRREFMYDGSRHGKVFLNIAVGGFYEAYVNGVKIQPAVLSPTPTNFDRRVYSHRIEITSLVRQGCNAVGVILGNSIYNCDTQGAWLQDTITWRDSPKLLCRIADEHDCTLVATDRAWRCFGDGPIRMDSIRNGEIYDARHEIPHWSEPGFDDTAWQNAQRQHAPGGIVVPEKHPSCEVFARLPMHILHDNIWDCGQNLAGFPEITVVGEAGAEIILKEREKLGPDGFLPEENKDTADWSNFILSGEFQTDHYILKGGGTEIWSPRFTYAGFRYIGVEIRGNAKLIRLTACAAGTAFRSIGDIQSSEEILNGVQRLTRWAYRSNFVGFPTDCPTREKQGWTGDALAAVETGLYNYDSGTSYNDWMDQIADVQRPSGQIPCKSPLSANGYNWGCGPAWDCAFILIPRAVYCFTGDDSAIRVNYDAMRRYLDYAASMMTDHISYGFGLGDWCDPDIFSGKVPPALVTTAYYYDSLLTMSDYAKHLNYTDDILFYSELAGKVRKRLLEDFYHEDGTFGDGSAVALAIPLLLEIAPDHDKTLSLLVKKIAEYRYRPLYGIIGAKFVPRALAENGHFEDALRLLLNPEFPGFADILRRGATTLWENWDGRSSLNHVMFGDCSAWLFRYPGGFRYGDGLEPGKFMLRPCFSKQIGKFRAEHRNCISEWEFSNGKFLYSVVVPDGLNVPFELPDGRSGILAPGKHDFVC